MISTINGLPWQLISNISSPVKELGDLKKVSTHFSLKSLFNCNSLTKDSLLPIFFIPIFFNNSVKSPPEILIIDIAPLPGGEEHAIIVSVSEYTYFIEPLGREDTFVRLKPKSL